MEFRLCEHTLFEFGDTCVRRSWATLFPASVVVLSLVTPTLRLKCLQKAFSSLTSHLSPLITLSEAEFLCTASSKTAVTTNAISVPSIRRTWRTVLLTSIALVEMLTWFGLAAFMAAVEGPMGHAAILFLVTAATWAYALAASMIIPLTTLRYDLVTLMAVELLSEILVASGSLYDISIGSPVPPSLHIVAHVLNLGAVTTILSALLTLPMNNPSCCVRFSEIGRSISPEDYTTSWSWITISWISPLIERGSRAMLNEDDIWSLSPTMQSRVIYSRFSQIRCTNLLRRIWTANSMDIIFDFLLSTASFQLIVLFHAHGISR
jgi:hypothetical protein